MIIPRAASATSRARIVPLFVSQNRGVVSVYPPQSSSFSGIQRTAAPQSRLYSSQQQQQQQYQQDAASRTMVSVAAAASLLLAASVSSCSPQTLCEDPAAADSALDSETTPNEDDGEDDEPETDPYDNLPEEDEPTHCSICLTYRQGPCRPYWRKVEACTKDHEKDNKKQKKKKSDNDDDDDGPSTRCFQYMMPWIDCASKHRNLYTLIEMDTNYTEGIQDLETTSLHFCWMPGTEPKIDWTNYAEDPSTVEEDVAEYTPTSEDGMALWKTLDPAMGDPKLITVQATVPTTIDSGKGILEVAYAVDQDNNVIGFAYGTKPSELKEESAGDDGETVPAKEDGEDTETTAKPKDAAPNDEDSSESGETTIPMDIRIVASRTREFVIAASYTHRIEGAKNSDETDAKSDNKTGFLETHLYKSKPFALADVPKVEVPPSQEEQ